MGLRSKLRDILVDKLGGAPLAELSPLSPLGLNTPSESSPELSREVPEISSYADMNWGLASWSSGYGDLNNNPALVQYLRGSSIVQAGVTYAGTNLAGARPIVVQLDADNKETEIPDHPMIQLLMEPNEDYGFDELIKMFAFSWVTNATAYIRKVRRGNNLLSPVEELRYEPHWTARPRWPQNAENTVVIEYYEVLRNGNPRRVEKADMIAFRDGYNPETRCGMNKITALIEEIFTDRKTSQHTARLMANGLVPSVVLALENAGGSPKAIQEAQRRLDNQIKSGQSNAIVVGGKGKLMPLAVDYSIEALAKLRQIPEERWCAAQGVSPQSLHFAVGDTTSTFSNVNSYQRQDYRGYIVPLHNYIAAKLTKDLLWEFGDTTRMKMSWDYSQVPEMQPDLKAEAEWVLKAFDADALMRSEVRERLGYRYEKGRDDKFKSELGTGSVALTAAEIQALRHKGGFDLLERSA